jgi:DNA-binding IclR family transcriptional regulator
MFFSSGLDEQIDPALLAFVKCHVTSPLKWEALRVLAAQDGTWLGIQQLARATHKPPAELSPTLTELVSEGVLEELQLEATDDLSYRLSPTEPTSVVLHRLIDVATHSQELRAIIAAYLQRSRRSGRARASAAA